MLRAKGMRQLFAVTNREPHFFIDSCLLIKEVKKHRVIFDMYAPGRNKSTVLSAWEGVCASLIPLFPHFSDNEKEVIRRKLRQRWSWMRSVLARDLRRQRPDMHMHLEWMQDLQFLVPLITWRKTLTKRAMSGLKTQSASKCELVSDAASLPSSPMQKSIDELNTAVLEMFATQFTPRRYHSQTDPDKNFLFAFLEFFRQLRPEQKTELRKKVIALFPAWSA